jgi:type II restriction/modification system DNA methylase subunit YeeA
MKPEEFIAKWRESTLGERSASQSHFNDLCELLGVPKPADADRRGVEYTFEKRVAKAGGSQGSADVWKRGHFAWEYKGDRKSLGAAYSQLKQYADALENPPLLIVSDMKEIQVRTNWTNSVVETTVYSLLQLNDPKARGKLRAIFTNPDEFRPTNTRASVTAEAAKKLGELAVDLRDHEFDARRIAHFLNRIVFCLFVEDIDLLPDRVFEDVINAGIQKSDNFAPILENLFRAMRKDHGTFGATSIPWFNGGLFDDDEVLPLNSLQIRALGEATRLDWGAIEPSIFGTLFERGLDPARRKQMASLFDAVESAKAASEQQSLFRSAEPDRAVGVHYTDADKIMKIVEPVVLRPLRAEWAATKQEILALGEKAKAARSDAARTKLRNELRKVWHDFRERLGRFRVLDPACGSGNFLYVALWNLKDFDLAVRNDGEALGLPPDRERIGPDNMLGIEINPYAAELARVTLWIGEIQWQYRKGLSIVRRPILDTLDGIVCRDALLNPDGSEAKWPEADCIIGNPPFLGTKRMIGVLGEDYAKNVRNVYAGRVSPFSDLVCWWFEKAGRAVKDGKVVRAGLVATNSIRGGKNRLVLDEICKEVVIYEAWDDEPWVIDGAAVRVSLVCFASKDDSVCASVHLDGRPVARIYSDLTAKTHDGAGSDLTKASRLHENRATAFVGTVKAGAFDIKGDEARKLLLLPLNPNGRPNADVIRPWANGLDVVRRPQDKWIIDFGVDTPEGDAALFEQPFKLVLERVRPDRSKVRRPRYRNFWWLQAEPCVGMREGLRTVPRCVVTPALAKHRLFVWLSAIGCPDHQLIVVARDDDTTFGILHSRFHEQWALRLGTSLEDRPRYTPSTTFETFPFPDGLTPNIPAASYASDPRAQAIAAAARRLNELREAWLNPPDLVRREPEVVPGFPDRIVPVNDAAAKQLKKRTLTNLYNERPTWLRDAHAALDAALAAAYGWPADIADDEALARLFALNQERAARDTGGVS